MIDYSRFCLPRCSQIYEVILPNVAAYAILTGMEGVPELLTGHASETVTANSAKNALSEALRRYGVNGAALDGVLKSIEDAGTETFVEDLGQNPPPPRKMIRYIANFRAAIKCGTNEGEEYHQEFRKILAKKRKYFAGRGEELEQEYYRTVDAVRKCAGDGETAPGHGST